MSSYYTVNGTPTVISQITADEAYSALRVAMHFGAADLACQLVAWLDHVDEVQAALYYSKAFSNPGIYTVH